MLLNTISQAGTGVTSAEMIKSLVMEVVKDIDKPISVATLVTVLLLFSISVLIIVFIIHKYFKKNNKIINIKHIEDKLNDICSGLNKLEELRKISNDIDGIRIIKEKLDDVNKLIMYNREQLSDIKSENKHTQNDIIRLENNNREVHIQLIEINSILKKLLDSLI